MVFRSVLSPFLEVVRVLLCWFVQTHYLGDILCCDGQKVDFVSQPLGGLHSGDVGVDQHRLDVLLFESFNSLKMQKERERSTMTNRCKFHADV